MQSEAKWTRGAIAHLKRTFRRAADEHPNLMKPYLIRLKGKDKPSQARIMGNALLDTFRRRYSRAR